MVFNESVQWFPDKHTIINFGVCRIVVGWDIPREN
jgi:hypothetical protein